MPESAPARSGVGGRGVAQLARAPVSKTGGWGFETLHPCQIATAYQPLRQWNRDVRISVRLLGVG